MIPRVLEELSQKLPKFPDGRIDYSNAETSAVINVFIICDGELLILKRSDKVGNYKKHFNVVAGYYDELIDLRDKVLAEVGEETGIDEKIIKSMKIYDQFIVNDKKINNKFYVFPVLITLKYKPKIVLDWEHTECKWIKPKELKDYRVVYGLLDLMNYLIK